MDYIEIRAWATFGVAVILFGVMVFITYIQKREFGRAHIYLFIWTLIQIPDTVITTMFKIVTHQQNNLVTEYLQNPTSFPLEK